MTAMLATIKYDVGLANWAKDNHYRTESLAVFGLRSILVGLDDTAYAAIIIWTTRPGSSRSK